MSDLAYLHEVYQACLAADDEQLETRNGEFNTTDINLEEL